MPTYSLPNPAAASSVNDTGSTTLSETGRVLCWRLAQLSEAGYSPVASAAVALRKDIDLHHATDLLRHGCPQRTALRILL